MDKDKSLNHGSSGLPPSGRFSAFMPNNESSTSSALPTDSCHFPDPGRFSHDISQMPDFPPKNRGHRRAHSEILGLPDDISFDSDLGVVGSADGPSFSDDTEEDLISMYIDMEKFNSSCATSGVQSAESPAVTTVPPCDNANSRQSERPRIRHQHSQSMDGSTSIKPELLVSGTDGTSLAEQKKAMSAAKLADLALMDPKRAKRIWANRQSAARSKERKMRYIAELERKVQTLQTEATTLSAQLTMLQTMEQQVHLQDALNGALREEVQRLKLATGQAIPNGGQMMNYGLSYGGNQQFYPHNNAMHTILAAHQFQQLQIQSQQQPQQQSLQTQPGKGPLPLPNHRESDVSASSRE